MVHKTVSYEYQISIATLTSLTVIKNVQNSFNRGLIFFVYILYDIHSELDLETVFYDKIFYKYLVFSFILAQYSHFTKIPLSNGNNNVLKIMESPTR